LRNLIKVYGRPAAGYQPIIGLAHYPDFDVVSIGYSGREMMVFDGFRSGDIEMRVFQHYTQVNVLVTFAPTQPDEPQRRPIGYLGNLDDVE